MAALIFDTPSGVVQCQDAFLLWSGGTSPYSVVVQSAQDPNNPTTLDFVNVQPGSTQATYNVAIPGDTLIKFVVSDANGRTAKTNLIAVGESSNQACLPPSEQTSVSSPVNSHSSSAASSPPPPPATSGTTSANSKSSLSPTSTAPGSTSNSLSSTSGTSSKMTKSRSSSAGGTSSASGVSVTSAAGGAKQTGDGSTAHSKGLSPGLFAGAAAAAILIILLVAGLCLYRRQRKRRITALEDTEDFFTVPGHSAGGLTYKDHSDVSLSSPRAARGAADPFAREFNETMHSASAYSSAADLRPAAEYAYPPTSPQDYYNADPKQRRVLRASTLLVEAPLPTAASSSSRAPQRMPSSRRPTDEIPTNLSPEELAQLADLVASRINTRAPAGQDEESPPAYH